MKKIKKGVVAFSFFLLLILFGCINTQQKEQINISKEIPSNLSPKNTMLEPQISENNSENNSANISTDNTTSYSDEQILIENETSLEVIMENASERIKCTRNFSQKFNSEPYYYGSLFDAHFHMPSLIDFGEMEGHGTDHDFDSITDPVLGKDVELEKILCMFDKENVTGIIGFSIGAEQLFQETIDMAESVNKNSSGKIRLFLMPFTFNLEKLDEIQWNNPNLFQGYGEIAFYFKDNPSPNSKKMTDIYKLAEKYDLIVMAHPDGRQENEIEKVIKENPNVKFLLHGPEIEDSIIDLMDRYPNVYYSLDAILIRLPNSPGALMYTVNSKGNFIAKFTENFDTIMDEAVERWKGKIELYPDRFMWGTDRAYKWTYDEEVSVLLEEFGRAFIARLKPSVQEKFAYKNAEELITV